MQISDYYCRKATEQDDVAKIAKYIHLTDPYIYPKIAPDPTDEAWVSIVSQCLKRKDNVFSLCNFTVITYGDEIVGLSCIIPCGKRLTFSEGIIVPHTFLNGISQVNAGYFDPLIEENCIYSGYNFVNVCIDEAHQGKGVGERLLRYCIAQHDGSTLHLDVIASNTAAIRLYEKVGFRICNEYLGFSGDDTLLPCYHMMRNTK